MPRHGRYRRWACNETLDTNCEQFQRKYSKTLLSVLAIFFVSLIKRIECITTSHPFKPPYSQSAFITVREKIHSRFSLQWRNFQISRLDFRRNKHCTLLLLGLWQSSVLNGADENNERRRNNERKKLEKESWNQTPCRRFCPGAFALPHRLIAKVMKGKISRSRLRSFHSLK